MKMYTRKIPVTSEREDIVSIKFDNKLDVMYIKYDDVTIVYNYSYGFVMREETTEDCKENEVTE